MNSQSENARLRANFWDEAFRDTPANSYACVRPYLRVAQAEHAAAKLRDISYPLVRRAVESAGEVVRDDSEAALFEAINRTESLQIPNDWDAFTRMEAVLVELISEFGLPRHLVGLEFPANIRIAHGKAPRGYTDRPFSTDHLHADAWAGEPDDGVCGLIYLGGDIERNHCQFYDFPANLTDSLTSYRGPYRDMVNIDDSLLSIDCSPQIDQISFFDVIVPHQTIRSEDCPRISVDFRMRRLDPYIDIDDEWTVKKDKFWRLHDKSVPDFRMKCRQEFESLISEGRQDAIDARKAWILKNVLDGEAMLDDIRGAAK